MKQVVDFHFAALTVLPSREEVLDFSYPLYSGYTGGLYKKPKSHAKVNMELRNFSGVSVPET